MKEDKKFKGFGTRVIVSTAALIIVIAGLKFAESVLVPFLFALFLCVLGTGPLKWLTKRKVPTSIAVLIITLVIVGILLGIGLFLVDSVNSFSSEIPTYRGHLNDFSHQINDWLKERGMDSLSILFAESFDPSSVMDIFGSLLKRLVGTLSSTFLVIILMIFMLLEAAAFGKKLTAALGDKIDTDRFEDTSRDVQRYLAIKTLTSATTGVLIGLWTAFLGIDFPILWGMTAFIMNYIPFVGSTIASVPAILLALITNGPQGMLVVGSGYLILNITISNFIEPILMGRRLGLSPLVVLLSLAFWGWIWGPGGALMSVPLTMIVKILFEHSDDFNWVAILLDAKVRTKKPTTTD